MAAITIANDVDINITPLFNKKFQFISLITKESYYGELPELELTIRCDEDVIKNLDEIEGSLVDNKGNSTNFKGYVYSISYLNSECKIKMIGVEKKFVRDKVVTKYSSIDNALKSLYPGDIISNSKTDLMSDIDIFQMSSTSYDLCMRCAQAYKKDTVYGFALNGLILNDLTNWKSKITLGARIELSTVTSPELTDPTLFSLDNEIIEYSSKDPNHNMIKLHNKILFCNKDYSDLVSNYLYNTRYMSTKNLANYSMREFINLGLCDNVEIKNNQVTVEQGFVTKKIMYFNFNAINIDYTIQSINP